MRELKFKAWIKSKEGFAEPGDFMKHGFYANSIPEWNSDDNISLWNFDDNVIYSQYTGLKDKNGKEIYEGDILTSTIYPFQSDREYNYHGEVSWGEEDAAFLLTKHVVNKNIRGISHSITDLLTDYDLRDFEVIGNVFENKNLLLQS